MADTRINALATDAAATAADDYFVIDGTTNGTRKHTAYTPVFSTVTASGSMSITGATGSLTLGAATETLTIAVTAAGAGTITPKSGQPLIISGVSVIGGTTVAPNLGLYIASSALTSDTQVGIDSEPVFSSAATVLGCAGYFAPATAAASFTQTSSIGVRIGNGTKGAGSTITTLYGLKIENQTAGVTNYAISTGLGLVLIGDTTASTSTSTGALVVSGGVGVAGAIYAGGSLNIAGATASFTAASVGVELGASGSSNTPFIDFHSSASATDYDARLIASGGTASPGQGDLRVRSATLTVDGAINAGSNIVITNANDGVGLICQSNTAAGSKAAIYWKKNTGTEIWRIIADPNADNGDSLVVRSNSGAGISALSVAYSTGDITIGSTTDSSDKDTGALVVEGGLGVEKAIVTGGAITTAAPTTGTAGAWKFGIRVAATTTLDTTQYIQLDVGGTLYKLAVVTV